MLVNLYLHILLYGKVKSDESTKEEEEDGDRIEAKM